jgi:chitin disaccharide deacetylase
VKSLIVTADDAGLHPGMTEGAIRAYRDGIATACSIVATGKAFDDAVARLRDVPLLEVGIHIALVEEESLTGITLPRSYPEFVRWYMTNRLPVVRIAREIRAQMQKVLDTGLRVTHVNGHQHLHLMPALFRITRDLAEENGIHYIRRVDDRGGRGAFGRRTAIRALNVLGRRVAGTNDRTIGVTEAGHLTASRIIDLLPEVDGVTELVTHPGVGVDAYPHWQYAWDEETRALCDPAVREAIAKTGIQLMTPSGEVRY